MRRVMVFFGSEERKEKLWAKRLDAPSLASAPAMVESAMGPAFILGKGKGNGGCPNSLPTLGRVHRSIHTMSSQRHLASQYSAALIGEHA